jgi:tetratricopeptide (TPR) repeat protein
MIEGDLEADILASIKPAPKEILALYEVFDELRVALRFTTLHTKDLTEAGLIYSQALKLFTRFRNSNALEICYRELGYICAQKELWLDAANFLNHALEIFLTYHDVDPLESCKRKMEVARAIVKSKEKIEKGMIIINQILEDVKKLDVVPEVCEFWLELAEIAYETGARNSKFFKDLHHFINVCDFEDKGIIRQRYIYIKALYLKNNKNYIEACKSLIFLLEEFPTYIPVIRMKSINIIKQINSSSDLNEQLSKHNPSERPSSKDIVLIVSNSLAQEAISSKIKVFAETLINKNDRLALIQSHSKPLVVFSLTKFPMTIMEFNINDLSLGFCLMDSMKTAIRHLQIKDNFLYAKKKRQSWIVVITDLQESHRNCKISEVVKGLHELQINVVVVDLSGKSEDFQFLLDCSQFNMVFEDVDYENFERILKEVVAFICPEKEVIDFKDGDGYDIYYY